MYLKFLVPGSQSWAYSCLFMLWCGSSMLQVVVNVWDCERIAQVWIFVLLCCGAHANCIQIVSNHRTYWLQYRTALKISTHLARGARRHSKSSLDSFLHMVYFIWYKHKNSVNNSLHLCHTFQLMEELCDILVIFSYISNYCTKVLSFLFLSVFYVYFMIYFYPGN